jgi:GAF domain-containing protein
MKEPSPAEPIEPLVTSIFSLKPFVVSDAQTRPDLSEHQREIARARGFRSQLVVPLLQGHTAIGVISVTRREAGGFTQAEVALLQTFADQAVIAIENVRLFTELQASNRELTTALDTQTATSDILRVISRSQSDVQPVFDAIVVSAVRLLGAYSGALTRIAGEQIELVAITSTSDVADAALRARFPQALSSAGPHARTIRDRAPLNIGDVHTDPRLPEAVHAFARLRGFRSQVVVPLLRHDEAIGTISLTRGEPGGFTIDEIGLLQTFADQAVIAIENARLFTELQEKNHALTEAHAQVTEALEQQTATSEILRTIAHAQTDAQPVFDTIVRSAARLCQAATAAVFLSDRRMLYHPANYGGSPAALAAARARYPMPLDMNSVPGMTVLSRSVVHVADVEDGSVNELIRTVGRSLGFRSIVSVPMLREGEAFGALLVTRREPGRFADGEVELLRTFADQAVIAIENVRLFTELQEKNRALTQAHAQVTEALDGGHPPDDQPDAHGRAARVRGNRGQSHAPPRDVVGPGIHV